MLQEKASISENTFKERPEMRSTLSLELALKEGAVKGSPAQRAKGGAPFTQGGYPFTGYTLSHSRANLKICYS